jgi:hypothetical protein
MVVHPLFGLVGWDGGWDGEDACFCQQAEIQGRLNDPSNGLASKKRLLIS